MDKFYLEKVTQKSDTIIRRSLWKNIDGANHSYYGKEEFKGALTENYVLNMLNIVFDNVPNYFTFDRCEIDFIIQNKNIIIPIEVKSGKSVNNTSLTRYNDKFANDISVRFSLNNLKFDGKIMNFPLYFIEYIYKFI